MFSWRIVQVKHCVKNPNHLYQPKKILSFVSIMLFLAFVFSSCAASSGTGVQDIPSFTWRNAGAAIERKGNILYYVVLDKEAVMPYGFVPSFLYYYDLESNESHPLCSKPDCDHTAPVVGADLAVPFFAEDTCTAFIGDASGISSGFDLGMVFSDDAYIYTMGSDFDYRRIIRFSPDGSTKENVAVSGKLIHPSTEQNTLSGLSINDTVIVNGTLFYDNLLFRYRMESEDVNGSTEWVSVDDGKEYHVYSCSLQNGTPETVFSLTAAPGEMVITSIHEREQQVFLQVALFSEEDYDNRKSSIYQWNSTQKSFERLAQDIPGTKITLCDNGFYYVDSQKKEVCRFRSNDQSIETLISLDGDANTEYLEPIFWGEYMIIPSVTFGSTIEVYHVESKEIHWQPIHGNHSFPS